MISARDFYSVLAAMVPLYVAMILAYGSVRWWKIFTPVQCSGINRFVAVFAVPLLSFHFIARNNPYKMDLLFILADTISKIAVFMVLLAWTKFSRSGSLDWLITLFSLATLPNTLVMGIPLLDAMYGQFYGGLMVQMVVLQCIIWYTLLLFLFEYRAARLLVLEQFPDTAASIISFKVEPDVVSLDERESLQTQADVDDDGKIRVTIRRSTSSRSQAVNSFASPRRSVGLVSMSSSKAITPRPSNLTGAEIYSIHSSRNNTPRDLNNPFLHSSMPTKGASPRQSNFTASDLYSVQSSRGPTPRASNVSEDNYQELNPTSRGLNSSRLPAPVYGPIGNYFGIRNQGQNGHDNHLSMQGAPTLGNTGWGGLYSSANTGMLSPKASQLTKKILDPRVSPRLEEDGKEMHMFVWSSTASPVSEGGLHVFGGSDFGLSDNCRTVNHPKEVPMHVVSTNDHIPNGVEDFSFGSKAKFPKEITQSSKNPSFEKPKKFPRPTVMVKLILQMVGRKLLRNPNTYSSLLGLTWSLVAFRWNVVMPKMVSGSIEILSNAGLGMAMFSLGLFMALQPRLIACGTSLAAFAFAVRFLTGPAIMAAASIAVGLRNVDLHAAIVQAALPQGIVPFVFSREYNLHPDILSTAVIFGMLIALPITLIYYVFLGL
eukprot:c28858_g1_i1 orf=697-2667(+)